MPSHLMSRRDLDFLLHEWLRVSESPEGTVDRETVDAVLDLAEQVATRWFAPHNRRNDSEEPRFDGTRVHVHDEVAPALAAYFEAGFGGMTMPEELGGSDLPVVVAQAADLWFSAANVGTAGYPFLTKANANLLRAHATPEQVATWVQPMVEGRFFGTMCLSEPQAGSSLADVTTRAVPHGDGTWRVRGNKMWISGGDHELSDNIVHLVLARAAGAPAGVRGLSLFIVPKVLPDGSRNDVQLAGLNHKMGMRGITNTLLNFGEADGAVGYLVGDENRGLAYMFHMMNEARVGVGTSAVALGYSGYLHALEYARTRPQGRPIGAKDPASPMVPIVDHADVRRMLLAMKSYVEGGLALELYCGRLLDEERTATDPGRAREARLLLEILTPIAKSWPSQWCLAANDLAIQVHGGYGYTREYPVEQLWRDNRLNPIHEGTHGIQALDLLGRKVTMADGAAVHLLAARMRDTIERAAATPGAPATHAAELAAHLDRTLEVTAALWATGDPALALADATTYLEVLGHLVVAWLWLDVELVATRAETATDPFHAGKRAAAQYFFTRELPRLGPQLDLLAGMDRLLVDLDPSVL
ncbi:acyl-CoA dehydrogenase [Nocardioides sp. S-58]|uniref:Acyl-CoA dehydrogenase n=1 Tax=Nocardioides renjunii TaxID=3095075 RepID=A0ABU5KAZ5_9ACTN|nr:MULTISPECIES: acyl-CoA dehydrogenase [unclassified Nocardioides]MDZ5662145.1 acyl-CoA dehydrogenase [Nocardioides sp. S-58]WQQ24382.1 acyl-CoA dehydrogenase [Nocardioides sp. S-34]